ncbi:MAG: hypothetical protein KKH61_19845 [Gammaproteobacteria bacterium]|nr:hypothetical protein [Gammaproteobacteria bacterium]
MTEILGWTATILSTISIFPQTAKVVKTGSTRDISWLWLILFVLATITWSLYGILERDSPIIVTNVILLLNAITITAIKIINRGDDQ